jgi:hypothetical protein
VDGLGDVIWWCTYRVEVVCSVFVDCFRTSWVGFVGVLRADFPLR